MITSSSESSLWLKEHKCVLGYNSVTARAWEIVPAAKLELFPCGILILSGRDCRVCMVWRNVNTRNDEVLKMDLPTPPCSRSVTMVSNPRIDDDRE